MVFRLGRHFAFFLLHTIQKATSKVGHKQERGLPCCLEICNCDVIHFIDYYILLFNLFVFFYVRGAHLIVLQVMKITSILTSCAPTQTAPYRYLSTDIRTTSSNGPRLSSTVFDICFRSLLVTTRKNIFVIIQNRSNCIPFSSKLRTST